MTSILFVCLGNICRSPMAEGVFLKIVQRENVASKFKIDSAGLLSYHRGEMPDSRMCYYASKRGYKLVHRSRQITSTDLKIFDLIIGMDEQNIDKLNRMTNSIEEKSKIHRMTDYLQHYDADHIPDPYYGGEKGFEYVIDLLEDACEGLFTAIKDKETHFTINF